MTKKVLVFAPDSIHTKKFTDMIKNDVEVLLITDPTDRQYDVKTIHMKRGLSMPFKIYSFIKDFKPDYIHVHTINRVSPFVYLFGYNKAPIILSAWGSSVLVIPKLSWFHKKIVQFCLRRSTVTTVDANIEKYAIYNLVGKDTITKNINFGMIPYPTDISFDQKENIIYSPRNHGDIYNIEKVIYSFYEFYKKNKNWKMVVSGIPHHKNTPLYKKMVKDLEIENAVEFTGLLSPEENALFNAKAKIVVSIPFSDGKSHSLMEAMYANAICFVSDLPSNHEIISHGVNGFIVDDHQLIDLNKYKKIDTDLMKAYNKCRMPEFSFEENGRKFLSIYQGNIRE